MKFLARYLDLAIIASVATISLLVTIADMFGLATGTSLLGKFINPEFFSGIETNKVILLLTSLVALRVCFIAIARDREPEAFEKLLENTIRDYDGTYLTEFSDAVEMEAYLARRISEAKESVRDLSWKDSISSQYELPKRLKAHRNYEDMMLRASKNIEYREIYVFTDQRRVDQCERRLKANRPGYSCSFFRNAGEVPRLQFVVIDDREVIFASSSYPKLCAIRGPSVGAIFAQYFDDAWKRAIPLRNSGKTLVTASKLIDEVKQELRQRLGMEEPAKLLQSPDIDRSGG